MSYQAMSSTRTQGQLSTATLILLFVQCQILFRLLLSSVITKLKFSWGNHMNVVEWTDTHGIHHWRIVWISYRKLATHICVYVCVYIYTCVCIYMYVYICVCVCMCVCVYIYIYINIYIYIYIYINDLPHVLNHTMDPTSVLTILIFYFLSR